MRPSDSGIDSAGIGSFIGAVKSGLAAVEEGSQDSQGEEDENAA